MSWGRTIPATRMATDAITFIKAMGVEQVDLFGFSILRAVAPARRFRHD